MNKFQKEIEKLLVQADEEVNKELYKAYTSSLRKIKSEVKKRMQDYESLSFLQRIELAHDYSLMLQIEEEMDILSKKQDDHIYRFLNQTGELGYNALFYEFEQMEKIRLNFTMLPKDVIETIIQTPVAGIRLSERLRDGVIKDLKNNLQGVMTSGFIKGSSYQEMAQALSEAGRSSYKRALNIARTEGGRVQAVTRQKSQKDATDMGINVKKQWVATLDGKTRDDHRVLDGQIKEVDEYFEVNGYTTLQPHMFGIAKEDCNCRCRTINVIKDYEHELRRDNENREVIKYENYREWARESESETDSYFDIKISDSIKKQASSATLKEVTERLNKAPKRMKDLWNTYADELNWGSKDEKLGDMYDPINRRVNLTEKNLTKQELYNDYDVFFHEFGHHIDGLAGRDDGVFMFSDFAKEELGSTLKKEAKDYINLLKKQIANEAKKQGLEKGKTSTIVFEGKEINLYDGKVANRHAYNFISEELMSKSAKVTGDVSDIWEGITKGKVTGSMGHGKIYWNDPYKLNAETFAEMTSATINNPESLAEIKKYFPKSYEAYLNMVDRIIRREFGD